MSYPVQAVRGVVTAEQLHKLNAELDGSYELVRGALIVHERPGMRHADIELNLVVRLRGHSRANGLGQVFGPDVGYVLSRHPDTVRSPDVSFVRADLLPPVLPTGSSMGRPILWSSCCRLTIAFRSRNGSCGSTSMPARETYG